MIATGIVCTKCGRGGLLTDGVCQDCLYRARDNPKIHENLNDALPAGKLEIWYMNPDHFRDGICGAKPDPKNLKATHIKLGSVAGKFDDLDDLWMKLQGERWSPNGEARDLIRSKGLRHTSMSVGDCFRFANGDVWICASCGFAKLGPETVESRTIKKVKP